MELIDERDVARAIFFRRKHMNQTYSTPEAWSDSVAWQEAKEDAPETLQEAWDRGYDRAELLMKLHWLGAPISDELREWATLPMSRLQAMIDYWG